MSYQYTKREIDLATLIIGRYHSLVSAARLWNILYTPMYYTTFRNTVFCAKSNMASGVASHVKPNNYYIINDFSKNLDMGRQTDVVLLDFSKAFDRVPHHRLCYKLFCYGIRGNTLSWIRNFGDYSKLL